MKPAQIPVTLGLIAVSVIVYLLFQWDDQQVLLRILITPYEDQGLIEVHQGEIWRLLTPIFLHSNLMHIVFNMIGLYCFGGLVEIRQGKWLLLLLVLLTGVLSNLAQYLVSGPYFGGMSGVAYALFGYVWMQGITNAEFGVKLKKQFIVFFLAMFFISWTGLLGLIVNMSIANTAHTAGLIGGMVLAIIVSLLFGRWQWRWYY